MDENRDEDPCTGESTDCSANGGADEKEGSRVRRRISRPRRTANHPGSPAGLLQPQIRGYKDREFARMYADEAMPGTGTKKREGFQSMGTDALAGRMEILFSTLIIIRSRRIRVFNIHSGNEEICHLWQKNSKHRWTICRRCRGWDTDQETPPRRRRKYRKKNAEEKPLRREKPLERETDHRARRFAASTRACSIRC